MVRRLDSVLERGVLTMSEAIKKGPFKYDVVGSFLRPEAVKEARAAFAEGI